MAIRSARMGRLTHYFPRSTSRRALLAGSCALGGFLVTCRAAPVKPPATMPPATPVPRATATPVPSPAASVAISATAASGSPRRGGNLVAAIDHDPVSLDPHRDPSLAGVLAYDQIYESLVDFDARMRVVPALATRWEFGLDGKSLTFFLRPGVTFHDGTALTADDVKYSLDRVLDPKTGCPFRDWIAMVRGVTVVDAHTARLDLQAPYAGLLDALAGLRASAIVPAGLAEKEDLQTKAIGTGPFKLGAYVPGSHLTYARHAAYWDSSLPYLDGLTYKVLPDESARVTALTGGQAQYAPLTAVGVKQLAGPGHFIVVKGPVGLLNLTYVNVSSAPLNDRRVRKALRLAVDTGQIIQNEALGAGVPSGPIPAGFDDWPLASAQLPFQKADVAAAKKLLADAGYPDGKGIALTVTATPQVPGTITRANAMRVAFKRLGIDLKLRSLDLPGFVRAYQQTDYDLLNSGNGFRPDPDGYVAPFYTTTGALNAGGYSNPSLDRLIGQARTTADPSRRKGLYDQIQTILLDDNPSFWWYTQVEIEALAQNVAGYLPSFTGRRKFMKDVWLAA